MPEETENTQNNSSDGTLNTDAGTQTSAPMIPKTRFDEVNRKMREYEKQLENLTRAQQEREEADRLAKGEHEKIIAELKPEAEKSKKLTQAVEQIYQMELTDVPEDMRDLIPDGDVVTRLTWLKNAKSRGFFKKPAPPVTDAGAQGQPSQVVRLSDEEKAMARLAGMTDEQYAKFKSQT